MALLVYWMIWYSLVSAVLSVVWSSILYVMVWICMRLPLWISFLVISCRLYLLMDGVSSSQLLLVIALFLARGSSYTFAGGVANWWAAFSNLVVLMRMIKASKNNCLSRAMGHKHQSQNDDHSFNAFLFITNRFNHICILCEMFKYLNPYLTHEHRPRLVCSACSLYLAVDQIQSP